MEPTLKTKLLLSRKAMLWGAVALAVIVVLAVVAAWFGGGNDPSVPTGAAGAVTRGKLVVSVEEDGEIEAQKRIVISNELQWPVVIDELVEDGKIVQAGETIVKFSCKALEDKLHEQELKVRSARSDHEQAAANLELKKLEVAEKVRKAEQSVKDAEADQKRYLEGEWPIKKRQHEQDILLLEREMAIAQADLDFKKTWHAKLEDKSPYSEGEIKSDQLALDRKKLALAKSKAELTMLLEYDNPKELRKLENASLDAKLGLERARHDARLELRKSEELVDTRKETLERHEKELADLQEAKEKLTVKAEQEGLVVYDDGRRWNPEATTIAKGEQVNHGQQIMIIPDMTTLQVRTKVYEAVSRLVQPGQKASIRLESRPQEILAGTVHKINVLPDRSNWWSPGIKVFPVTVKFDQKVEGIRPNMTARVELELACLDDVVLAPVAAVFSEQDKTYCWVVAGGGARKTQIEVGLSNNRHVQVVKGLREGQEVLLIEPSSGGDNGESSQTGPMGMPG